ncbi:MAG: carbohydrate porin [Alphaproteobacteria bacterium]|nr:carbohydrate porin [Alphaproteobacteria bacterium]
MNKKISCGLAAFLALGVVDSAEARYATKMNNDFKTAENGFHRVQDDYQDFKAELKEDTGLSYDGAISILGQRATPSGKITPFQVQYYGEADWQAFESEEIGSGSFQISYTSNRYMKHKRNGAALGENIGVVDGVNDYGTNQNYFNQLTYTHQMPADFKWLSVTFGQFPMYNFDGNPYASNQQTQFINDAFSQNGSDTYPSASIGGFVSVTPNDEWTASIGYQDAHNISGREIKTNTASSGKYTGFGYVAYTPKIEGLGQGLYSLTVYHQPSVKEQPENSYGWSLNLAQDIGKKWAVFSRINGSSHSSSLKQSYVLGGVYKDPFDRENSLDGIGFAAGVNKINHQVVADARKWENVMETYLNYGIGNNLLLTPDVQMYIKPALSDKNTAFVYSLRATLLF